MKKLLLAVCLMVGGATFVSAQNEPVTTPGQTQTQDQEGQQIAASELPDAVTAKLEGQDYSGWTVGNAYKKMDDSNQEMFVVELRQGTETKKVKFDKDGNEIEKDKGDKADHNYRSDDSQSQPAETETEPATVPDQSTEQADNASSETEQQ